MQADEADGVFNKDGGGGGDEADGVDGFDDEDGDMRRKTTLNLKMTDTSDG